MNEHGKEYNHFEVPLADSIDEDYAVLKLLALDCMNAKTVEHQTIFNLPLNDISGIHIERESLHVNGDKQDTLHVVVYDGGVSVKRITFNHSGERIIDPRYVDEAEDIEAAYDLIWKYRNTPNDSPLAIELLEILEPILGSELNKSTPDGLFNIYHNALADLSSQALEIPTLINTVSDIDYTLENGNSLIVTSDLCTFYDGQTSYNLQISLVMHDQYREYRCINDESGSWVEDVSLCNDSEQTEIDSEIAAMHYSPYEYEQFILRSLIDAIIEAQTAEIYFNT